MMLMMTVSKSTWVNLLINQRSIKTLQSFCFYSMSGSGGGVTFCKLVKKSRPKPILFHYFPLVCVKVKVPNWIVDGKTSSINLFCKFIYLNSTNFLDSIGNLIIWLCCAIVAPLFSSSSVNQSTCSSFNLLDQFRFYFY